jgi:hypothetical protein
VLYCYSSIYVYTSNNNINNKILLSHSLIGIRSHFIILCMSTRVCTQSEHIQYSLKSVHNNFHCKLKVIKVYFSLSLSFSFIFFLFIHISGCIQSVLSTTMIHNKLTSNYSTFYQAIKKILHCF